MRATRFNKIISSVSAAAIALLGLTVPTQAAQAAGTSNGVSLPVCSDIGVTVAPLHGENFFVDSLVPGRSDGSDAGVIGYSVKAVAGFTDLAVDLSSMTGPVYLGAGQPAVQPYGAVAPNTNAHSYFFVAAAQRDNSTNTNINVKIMTNGQHLCQYNDVIDNVYDRQDTNANKIYNGYTVPTSDQLIRTGGSVDVFIEGNTGIIGAGPYNNYEMDFYAVTKNNTLHAATWELKDITFRSLVAHDGSTRTTCGDAGYLRHRIHWDTGHLVNTKNCEGEYLLQFRFEPRANAPEETTKLPSFVRPWSWIASGSKIKHTVPYEPFQLPIYNNHTPAVINTNALPNGVACAPYSFFLDVTLGDGEVPAEGPGWEIVSGSLPSGFSLDAQTGEISGTTSTAGNYVVKFGFTDTNGLTVYKTLGLTIEGATPPVITTESLANGKVDVAYSQDLEITLGSSELMTSGTPWTIVSGALPDGLSIDPLTGTISGTPTKSGQFTFTVQLMDSCCSVATKFLSITIVGPPVITTTSLPGGIQGYSYSQPLAADPGFGGTIPTEGTVWELTAGNLPDGLTLDPTTGVISGTPTKDGEFCFTVKVTDSNELTDTQDLCITIVLADPPVITTESLPDGTVAFPYQYPLAANKGTAEFGTEGTVWELIEGSLPNGLSLDSTTGNITGIPTQEGEFCFTVKVTDLGGLSDTQDLCIKIGKDGASGTTEGTDPLPLKPNLPETWKRICLVDPADGQDKDTVVIPNVGTFVLSEDGTVTFTAVPGWTGTYTVQECIVDSNDGRSELPIKVTVIAPDAPEVTGDSDTTVGTTPVDLQPSYTAFTAAGFEPTVCLVNVAVDPETCTSSVTVAGKGTFVLNADGTVTFTAVLGFTGTVSVPFRVTDAYGQSDEADVTVTVTPPAAPTVTGDTKSTTGTAPVTLNPVSERATTTCLIDPSDDICKGTVIIPGKGTFVLNADGTVTFTAVNGFSGDVTVTIKVEDDYDQTDTDTLTVTVNKPQAPDVTGDTKSTTGVAPVTLEPTTERETSTCLIDPVSTDCKNEVTIEGKGTFKLNADGTVTFTAVLGFSGDVTVTIKVEDDYDQTDTDTLNVTVNKPAGPEVEGANGITPVDTPIDLFPNVPGNPDLCLVDELADPETCGDEVTVPNVGKFTLNPDGTVTFNPVASWTGTYTVPLRATDAYGQSSEGPITVTIPLATDPRQGSTTGTTPVTLTPKEAAPVGADVCLVDPKTGVCGSTVTIASVGTWKLISGKVQFQAVAGYVGTNTVQYRVTAGQNTSQSPFTVIVGVKKRAAKITIGHFKDGKPQLTSSIKAQIKKFIKKNQNYRQVTCQGVTEGPTVLKSDLWLSKQRAINACAYVLGTLDPNLKKKALNSKQETRVGSKFRRITIILND